MIEPIVIRFATAGIPEVSAAFARVETQAKKFEDQMTVASEKGGRARIGAADKEARDKMRAGDRVAKEAEKAQRDATRELERESKRRQDIVKRSSEMAGRDAVRAAQAEAKETSRIHEQNARQYIKFSEMRSRAVEREAADAQKVQQRVAAGAGKYAKTWGGRLGGVASAIGMTAGIGGAFAAVSAARSEMSDERKAALLVNQVTTGAKPPAGASVGAILGQAGAISRDTGIDRGSIVEAGLTYAQNARRGDFRGAMGNMSFFAKMNKVTGVDMNELASAAGTLQSQNADLDPAAMQQMLLNAYAQSKQGTMSLAEAAKTMGIQGSTRSSFQGDVTENQRQLLGFAQIAKSGGDAGEAGTFVKDIALEAGKANAKFMKDTKHDPGGSRQLFKTDEHGRMLSPESLILDTFRNTKGNIQQINDLYGVRGGAMFRELEGSYIAGAGKNNDVEKGVAAVQANMREVTGATMTANDLDAQFKQSMDTPAEKIGTAMNKIQEEMEEKLAPALASFADKLADPAVERNIGMLIDGVGKLAEFLIKNPLAGIGNIIALAVTKDILQAAIGAGIKNVLMGLLSGTGGAGGIGAGAGALGKVGAAVGIAAGATAITYAGMSAIDAYNAQKRDSAGRDIGAALSGSSAATDLQHKAKSRTVSAEDIAKMTAAAEAQQKVVAEKEAAMKGGPGAFATLVGAGGDVAADQKAQFLLQKSALDDMVRSIKEASAALRQLKTTTPTAVPAVTAGAPAAPTGSHARI